MSRLKDELLGREQIFWETANGIVGECEGFTEFAGRLEDQYISEPFTLKLWDKFKEEVLKEFWNEYWSKYNMERG